jgi:hypothetical protein
MHIPWSPDTLTLPICTYWDGTSCPDQRLHGTATLSAESGGLRMSASLPHQATPRLPTAPPYTRVANLWEYDVVECFLAGTDTYLEVELGAGGHFLVLDFTAPRLRRCAYETFKPQIHFDAHLAGGTVWQARILLPWALVPEPVSGINAYVISGTQYLCYHPLPGPQPDFHQPARFPRVRLTRRG